MIPALLSTLVLGAPLCGPIDLDAALALALERSDEVAIKQADVASAEADLALARAIRYVPEANTTLSIGPSPAAHGTITDVKFGSSRSLRDLSAFGRVEVNALQPLYTWGRLDAARDAATAGVRGREDLVQDTQSQIQVRIAQLYWGVSLANRLLAISADVRKAAAEASQKVDESLKEGDPDITQADKFRVQIFQGVVEGRTAEAQKALDLARIGLAATLALTPSELVLKQEELPSAEGAEPDVEKALAAAAEQRPDLRALGEAIQASEAQVRAAKGAELPQFFIAGQFAYSYAPNRDIQDNPWAYDPLNTLTIGGVVGVRQDLAFPKLTAEAQKAQAQRDGLERQRAGLLRLVAVQVESAVAEVHAARSRLLATRSSFVAGRSLFRSVGLDFAAGVTDAKSLIESYTLFVQSQVEAAQAVYDLLVARARLAQAVGEKPRKGRPCELR